MFPQTINIWLKIHRYVPIWRHQSARIEPCGGHDMPTKGGYKDEIKESKTYIKKIKFAFDIENIGENLDNKGNHVECVVLMARRIIY